MKRRISIEVTIGVVLIALFIWRFYMRPQPGPNVLGLNDPAVLESISENKQKVLVIGIDGMTWPVALELMNQGKMPHFIKLFSNSVHGDMHSEPPLISPAIWTTFATGQSRSIHGIDNFFAKLPGQYKEVSMTTRFRRVPALWNIASRAGRTVGVVNWNAAYPAEEVNGVFMAYGVSPDNISEDTTYPSQWGDSLRSMAAARSDFMEGELEDLENTQPQKAYDTDRFVYSAARKVLKRERPDLMMVYFSGVDVVSHIYWKYRWPFSKQHEFLISNKGRELYESVIENHYVFTDSMIGGLLEEAEGYTIFLISDHGIGPNYPPNNYYLVFDKLLERMGCLNYTKDRKDIEWSKTTAWSVNDMRKKTRGIFLNVENKNPKGIIFSKEYESFRHELIRRLQGLRTEKGRPLFVEVGPGQDNERRQGVDTPDILAEVDKQALADRFIFRSSDDPDPIPVETVRWVYSDGSGDHVPDGVFLLSGPDVPGFGELDISLYDIAPTILWVLGLPIGTDMPGRVLKQAFAQPISSRESLFIDSWTGKVKGDEKSLKPLVPDKEHLDRLRALGYIQDSK